MTGSFLFSQKKYWYFWQTVQACTFYFSFENWESTSEIIIPGER